MVEWASYHPSSTVNVCVVISVLAVVGTATSAFAATKLESEDIDTVRKVSAVSAVASALLLATIVGWGAYAMVKKSRATQPY